MMLANQAFTKWINGFVKNSLLFLMTGFGLKVLSKEFSTLTLLGSIK